jgi:predicted transcriptional regulator
MKTAVSIPDDIFEKAEKAAAELSMSRSAFYAKALGETIKRIEGEAITAQINAALDDAPQSADPSYSRRMRRELERDGGW